MLESSQGNAQSINGERSSNRRMVQKPDLHVLRSVSQQTTEGDGVRYSSQVNKHNSRQGLNVKRVGEVTDEERRFSLNVKFETPTKPEIGQTRSRCQWY